MFKKPSIILPSYGSFQQNYSSQQCNVSPSSSLSSHHRSRRQPTSSPASLSHNRNYTSTKPRPDNLNDSTWPTSSSATAIPTPYQILSQKKGHPYSKRRFYELVKIYHPDHHHTSPPPSNPHPILSPSTKLARYRLIVQAHTILSSPAKRSAYDHYGAGWDGQPEITHSNPSSSSPEWTGFDHNAYASTAQNATWEDWERWYQAQGRSTSSSPPEPQEPVYFSNGGFISLLVIFAALGGVGQATRVGDLSRSFFEQIEEVHDGCSKELMRRRGETQEFGNKGERIETFVRNRGGGWGWDEGESG